MSSHQPRSYHNWKKLPGEYPNGDKIQFCLFIAFLVVWIGDYILEGTMWLNQFIPLIVRLFFGFSCILISYYLLRQSEADLFFHPCSYNEPVQFGIYHYCRHPMYLGVILFHIGLGLISVSLIGWILFFITMKFYNFLANYEEKKLIEKFGSKYQKYMKDVPKWIPKIRIIIIIRKKYSFEMKIRDLLKLRFLTKNILYSVQY